MRTEPIIFGGNELRLAEDIPASRSSQAPISTTLFAPRKLGPSKPKAGLGYKKDRPGEPAVSAPESSSAGGGSKSQDDFRKMLLGVK